MIPAKRLTAAATDPPIAVVPIAGRTDRRTPSATAHPGGFGSRAGSSFVIVTAPAHGPIVCTKSGLTPWKRAIIDLE